MPEISGVGQKILLESTAFIYGETVNDISPLIYYLAASGIGHIYCYFQNDDDYEILFDNIRDLNNDIIIGFIYEQSLFEIKELVHTDNSGAICRVFLGSIGFISKISNNIINLENEKIFIPTIIALKNQWKGTLQTFDNFDELNAFIEMISNKCSYLKSGSDKTHSDNFDGSIFSTSILGALCSIEFLKLCLNIGEIHKDLLYFDILSMEFKKMNDINSDFYIDKLLSNYYDDLSSSYDDKKKLSECKVLIVGTGGLGSPAALALSMARIGTIGLIDYDRVEISNLNRQILHSTSRIGLPKVDSAKSFLEKINPSLKIITYNNAFSKDNAVEIINSYDIIIDGVDNLPTRYLLNDACYFMKKPMIEAGVLRFSGLNTTIIPDAGHCYRCVFPGIPKTGSSPSCGESGILGPVPGVMGFIQAAEAIKVITGKGYILKDKLLYFEALDLEFTIMELNKNPDCHLCGKNASINSLHEYKFTCENKKN